MKRVFSLLLALIMVISLVSIPAFAATEDSTVNNLLVYDTYSVNGIDYLSPSVYTASNNVRFMFGDGYNIYGPARLVIGINALTQPQRVQIYIQGYGNVTFTYLYSHNSIHYYESSFNLLEWYDRFSVYITWSVYDGVVSIESFYYIELYSNFYELDTMQAHLTGTAWNGEDLSYFVQDAVNSTVSLPYSSSLTPDSFNGDPPIDGLMYDYFTFDLDTDYAKQFVFTFISTGVWPNYYDHDGMSVFGVTLIDGESFRNLSYTAASAIMDSSWKGLPVYRFSIYVDLTDIDLSDCSLMISVMVQGVEEYHLDDDGQVVTDPFWFIRVEEAGYYQSVFKQRWYDPILSFFIGIYDVVIERLYSIDYAITDKFNSLEAKLDELFGGITDPGFSPIDQEDMDNIQSESDNANSGLGDVIEEIEGATPELPSFDDTGLGEFAGDVEGDTSPVLPVFIVIYENPMILKMMLYCFMFALGGFLLFGER